MRNAAVEGNRVIRVRATGNNTQSVGLSQKDVCLTNRSRLFWIQKFRYVNLLSVCSSGPSMCGFCQ